MIVAPFKVTSGKRGASKAPKNLRENLLQSGYKDFNTEVRKQYY